MFTWYADGFLSSLFCAHAANDYFTVRVIIPFPFQILHIYILQQSSVLAFGLAIMGLALKRYPCIYSLEFVSIIFAMGWTALF